MAKLSLCRRFSIAPMMDCKDLSTHTITILMPHYP